MSMSHGQGDRIAESAVRVASAVEQIATAFTKLVDKVCEELDQND